MHHLLARAAGRVQSFEALDGLFAALLSGPDLVMPSEFLPDILGDSPGESPFKHALRRKWATERKGYPINDLAAGGGWRDTPTLLASYLRTDRETIAQVVLNPTMRLASR